MNWPIFWFVVAVVGCLSLLYFTKKAVFVPLLALVVYLAVHFQVTQWVSWLFWLLFGISAALSLIKQRKPSLAVGALALVVALLAASSAVVGWANPWGSDDNSRSSTSSETPANTDETSSTTTSSTTTTTSPEVTTTTGPVEAEVGPEITEVLTIRSTTIDCVAIVRENGGEIVQSSDGSSVYRMREEAQIPVGEGGRIIPDGLALPASDQNDPVLTLNEAILAICQGPDYGGAWMHMFAHLTVDGHALVDLNPWLLPSQADDKQINDMAQTFVRNVDGYPARDYFLSVDYQVLAEFTAELLVRGRLVGVLAEQSVLNYHLAGGGMTAGQLPEIEVNSVQEALPAVVIEYYSKTGECLLRIGINVRDKRPEIFSCLPTPEPPCTSNCGNGGTPTTTTIPDGRKGTPVTPATPPATWNVTPTTLYCAYGLEYRDGECRYLGDDSGAGAPEPEYPSWGPIPTSEPPGSVPPTSSPPATGNTVAGP